MRWGIIVFCSLLLSGCQWSKQSENFDTITFANEECQAYVDYLLCLSDEMGVAGKSMRSALYKTTSAWVGLSDETLELICGQAIDGLTKVSDMYARYDCVLPDLQKGRDAGGVSGSSSLRVIEDDVLETGGLDQNLGDEGQTGEDAFPLPEPVFSPDQIEQMKRDAGEIE